MLTVSCLSQKGGVGKSTMARMLATAYAQAGWRVKLADFNLKQKTSVDWASLRLESDIKPAIAAEPFSDVKRAMLQRNNFDIMVFDGRPDSDTTTRDIAENSDMIIIPVGTPLDDLQPQVRFAHELRARGIDRGLIVFVINKAADSQVAVADAREFILSAGYQVASTDIPSKTGYEIAQNSGRAITETTFPTLNQRCETLAQELVSKLTELTTSRIAK